MLRRDLARYFSLSSRDPRFVRVEGSLQPPLASLRQATAQILRTAKSAVLDDKEDITLFSKNTQ